MPKKISYVVLACMMLNVDPQALLSFHEYNDRLAIVTTEGKKFTFNFKQLDDYHQYLLDNQLVVQAELPDLNGISKPASSQALPKSTVKKADVSRKTKKSNSAKNPNKNLDVK